MVTKHTEWNIHRVPPVLDVSLWHWLHFPTNWIPRAPFTVCVVEESRDTDGHLGRTVVQIVCHLEALWHVSSVLSLGLRPSVRALDRWLFLQWAVLWYWDSNVPPVFPFLSASSETSFADSVCHSRLIDWSSGTPEPVSMRASMLLGNCPAVPVINICCVLYKYHSSSDF